MPCANSFESFFLKVSHGKDHKENRDLRSDSNHRHLNFWIDRGLGIDARLYENMPWRYTAHATHIARQQAELLIALTNRR